MEVQMTGYLNFTRTLAAAAALWIGAGLSGAFAQDAVDLSGTTLTVVTQSPQNIPGFEASGLFKGTSYTLKFAVVTGTSAVVSTLLSGAGDLGTLGDFSLILAQSNAQPEWPADDIPLKNVLALKPADPVNFPLIVTIAGKDSGIKTVADIKGKKFSYTPGGNANLQYLLTLKKAGLTPADVTPVQLDFGVGATALANGQVDVITNNIQSSGIALDAGAYILATADDVGLPGVNTLTANSDALKDPKKVAAIRDFIQRYLKFNLWQIQNPEAIEATYVSGAKQTPKQAVLSWKSARQVPVIFDDKLFTTEQGIADTVKTYGLVKRSIDIKVQYDDEFNDVVSAYVKDSGYADIAAKSVADTLPPKK
jgi:sulfonate transport system substrate-binding protein